MFLQFLKDCGGQLLCGGRRYWVWVGVLTVIAGLGLYCYSRQLREGLIVTGMSDQVVWGAYISNFTYLVGMAAAVAMLAIPAYIFKDPGTRTVILLGAGIAVAACAMAMAFVVVDLGHPERAWHMLPFIGRLNFPRSMLAWDTVVLSVYLMINFALPMYLLYHKYCGSHPDARYYFPVIILGIVWAIALHTVTAFLFSADAARPFWHTAMMDPRFLASAFAAGPAFMILAFHIIDEFSDFVIPESAIRLLSLITAGALQINLLMIGAELFTEFYFPTRHSASAYYLFFGLEGYSALVPWIWSALIAEVAALGILLIPSLRNRRFLLLVAALLVTVGVWIEKGMGMIIPGFVPSPLGEIVEYTPSRIEIGVAAGIWAAGFLLFTLLAKMSIAIDTGKIGAGSSAPSDHFQRMGQPQLLENQ